MKKALRIALYSLAIIATVILIASVIGFVVINNKIEQALNEDLPPHFDLNYEDLNVRTLSGSLNLKKVTLNIKDKKNDSLYISLTLNELKIQNLSYWDYLFNNQITLGALIIDNPEIKVYQRNSKEKDATNTEDNPNSIEFPMSINKIEINNAVISSYKSNGEQPEFYTENLFLTLSDMSYINDKNQNLPITYKEIEIQGDSLFFNAGQYENLTVNRYTINTNSLIFNNINFHTKYSTTEFNALIPYERDHYDIKVPELQIFDYDYGFENDSLTNVSSSKIQVSNPKVAIYRDKTIEKDTTFKPLYNRSLRTLPFNLSVDLLKITQADIHYTERHQKENRGGKLTFNDLNAEISDVGNTYETPVFASIQTKFMNNAQVAAKWELDVHSPIDQFLFKAEVAAFNAVRINDFVTPNLNVSLEGTAHKTYFTIDGNNENSKTDLRIRYSGLKINFLKKDKSEKRKIISSLANMVIPKSSKDHGKSFNESTGKTERKKTQSVFNQLWISLESALKEAMLPGLLKKQK